MTKLLRQPAWIFTLGVDDGAWTNLETVGRTTLSLEHRDRLKRAMDDYRERADLDAAAVRVAKVRPILMQLAEALAGTDTALNELLRAQPPEYPAALREIQKAAVKHKVYAGRSFIKGIKAQIGSLRTYADAAIDELPSEMGTGRSNRHIADFVDVAHSIFADAGGYGIYTDDAYNFLKALCNIVGYRVQSRAALHQILKARSKVAENRRT